MQTTYEPIVENSPVAFTVKGFPIDEQIRDDIENFYKTGYPKGDRRFLVYNTFKEQIFSGSVDMEGSIEKFEISPRPIKS